MQFFSVMLSHGLNIDALRRYTTKTKARHGLKNLPSIYVSTNHNHTLTQNFIKNRLKIKSSYIYRGRIRLQRLRPRW